MVKVANKKVKMLVKISGSHDGEDWPGIGGEVNLPADEADRLVRNGMATPADLDTENAILDATGVETATADTGSHEGQKSVRLQMNPAPHADEAHAYHVPPVPGEHAAAEAAQVEVDEVNKEVQGEAVTEANIAIRNGERPETDAPKATATKRTTKKDA
jgi:hypothetical protein